MLFELAYISRETKRLDLDALTDLLHAARKFNKVNNITGMLLYNEGEFIQILEGDELTVGALFEKIQMDDRHTEVNPLFFREKEKRNFSDWAMGIKLVEHRGHKLSEVVSFNYAMNSESTAFGLKKKERLVYDLVKY